MNITGDTYYAKQQPGMAEKMLQLHGARRHARCGMCKLRLG